VSQVAKDAGMKVVLSADGGDELFGGYARYEQFLGRWNQAQRLGSVGRVGAKHALRAFGAVSSPTKAESFERYADLLSHDSFIDFYQNMFANASTREIGSVFADYRRPAAAASSGVLLNQMMEWDFRNYLVDDILTKVDRATMYNSIEGREPFLDHRLIEFAAQLPVSYKIRGSETKYLLKKLLARYLPEHLYRLPKRGFAIPFSSWMSGSYMEEVLAVLDRMDGTIFNTREVRRLSERHRKGQAVNYNMLWLLFSFQTWYEKWTADAR
jgi:asparagine synthase (glutamine-hydrolysing)